MDVCVGEGGGRSRIVLMRRWQVKDTGQERWVGGKEQMFQSLESVWANG